MNSALYFKVQKLREISISFLKSKISINILILDYISKHYRMLYNVPGKLENIRRTSKDLILKKQAFKLRDNKAKALNIVF